MPKKLYRDLYFHSLQVIIELVLIQACIFVVMYTVLLHFAKVDNKDNK